VLELLPSVIPIIPEVVGEKASVVAVGDNKVGVMNAGEVEPAKFPVPVWPESPTFNTFCVVIT
jgi:hypothetical protein